MSATNRRPPQIPSDEESALAREAGRQLARLLPEGERPLRLVTEDNRHEMISIPPGAVRLFVDILTQLGQGRAVTIVPGKVELTTQDVADYLNVSRPYVVKLIETGKLPADASAFSVDPPAGVRRRDHLPDSESAPTTRSL